MSEHIGNFSTWLIRFKGAEPERIASDVSEPAQAADYAEDALLKLGQANESYAEIRYNGDTTPHTTICLLEKEGREWVVYGVHNSEHAPWPIFYEEGDLHGKPLDDLPGLVKSEQAARMQEASAAEKKASSKDTGNMQIGDDDEDKPDEEDIEDGGDEGAEDEEVPEEDGEDEGRDDDDGDDEAQDDEGEDFSEEEEEDESEPEDEDDPEGEDGAGNSEQDGNEESEDGSEDDSEDEEEVEMPRLGIFAKFRGPLGWRKRAEAEDLNSSNKFVLKLGVLDPEAEKAAKQESEVFATVEFIESDEDRANGLLRLKLPEGVEFTQKGKWLQATIPYRQQEA